jgi:hypothetical protein
MGKNFRAKSSNRYAGAKRAKHNASRAGRK